jgi:hypothetical protein
MPWDDQFEYKFTINSSNEESLSDAQDTLNLIISDLLGLARFKKNIQYEKRKNQILKLLGYKTKKTHEELFGEIYSTLDEYDLDIQKKMEKNKLMEEEKLENLNIPEEKRKSTLGGWILKYMNNKDTEEIDKIDKEEILMDIKNDIYESKENIINEQLDNLIIMDLIDEEIKEMKSNQDENIIFNETKSITDNETNLNKKKVFKKKNTPVRKVTVIKKENKEEIQRIEENNKKSNDDTLSLFLGEEDPIVEQNKVPKRIRVRKTIIENDSLSLFENNDKKDNLENNKDENINNDF